MSFDFTFNAIDLTDALHSTDEWGYVPASKSRSGDFSKSESRFLLSEEENGIEAGPTPSPVTTSTATKTHARTEQKDEPKQEQIKAIVMDLMTASAMSQEGSKNTGCHILDHANGGKVAYDVEIDLLGLCELDKSQLGRALLRYHNQVISSCSAGCAVDTVFTEFRIREVDVANNCFNLFKSDQWPDLYTKVQYSVLGTCNRCALTSTTIETQAGQKKCGGSIIVSSLESSVMNSITDFVVLKDEFVDCENDKKRCSGSGDEDYFVGTQTKRDFTSTS